MRLHHLFLLLPLFSAPAFAEPDRHGRRSTEAHFADANTTHDGHLTLDQAKTGYKSLAKPFAQIDLNHRGYLTLDDIKAWKAAKKAARHATRGAAQGTPREQEVGRWLAPRAANAPEDLVVPVGERRIGVDMPLVRLDNHRPS